MAHIKIRIDTRGFERAEARLRGISVRVGEAPALLVREDAAILVDALREEAPKRTGRLAAGIFSRVEGPHASFWGRAPYTGFVLEGTAPHQIWAGFYSGSGSARSLSWPGLKSSYPIRMVNHPGTQENPFNRRAFESTQARLEERLRLTGRWIMDG